MRRFAFVWLLAAISVGTACSSPEPATPTPVPEPSDFERILSLIPDTPESRAFTRINNYGEIIRTLGIEAPGEEATFKQIIDYRLEIVSHGRQTGFPRVGFEVLSGFDSNFAENIQDTNATLDFDSRHVQLSAIAGNGISGTGNPIEIVMGDIDAAKARQFLNACETCALEPETVNYSGVTYHTWGAGQILRATYGLPLFDEFGRGGSLYFEDGFGVRTRRSEEIESVIDISSGVNEGLAGLAGLEAWRLAARALAALDAPSAVFSDRTDMTLEGWPSFAGFTQESREYFGPEILERLYMFDQIIERIRNSSPLLPQFELIASGTGWENDRAYSALVVVFADEETAEEAASALSERASTGLTITGTLETVPWSDFIESAEIEARGRVVTAKIVPAEPEEKIAVPPGLFVSAFPFASEVPYVQFLLR